MGRDVAGECDGIPSIVGGGATADAADSAATTSSVEEYRGITRAPFCCRAAGATKADADGTTDAPVISADAIAEANFIVLQVVRV